MARSQKKHYSWLAVAATATLALAGCTASAPASEQESSSLVAEFGHVHALGVDHTTGELFVATHNGVWLLPTDALPASFSNAEVRATSVGGPQQIAGRAQDTMAFTMLSDGTMLASGHPDPEEQPELDPANLGLISSSDQAESWQTLSLRADTDFHSLDAAELANGELRVVGYDATRGLVRASDDGGINWTAGTTLSMVDLAIDPSSPERVVATTADGLMESLDGARSFAPASAAPALYLVDSADGAAEGGFVGIDVNGSIWHTDASGAWVEGGTVQGAAEAVHFVGGASPWIVVSDERGIAASDDYGASWTIVVAA